MWDDLGSDRAIVSAVYLAVFIPWGFLYFHDFISSRWIPIGTTYRNGWIHIFTISLPMPFIIFYIIAQAKLKEEDFKEMYAAIAALALSLFHFSRTVWGLRQVAQFRKWAIQTTITMQRASYACKYVSKEPIVLTQDKTRRSSSFFRTGPLPDPTALNDPTPTLRRRLSRLNGWLYATKPSIGEPTLPLSRAAPVQVPARVQCSVHTDGQCEAKVDIAHIEKQVNRMLINNTIIDNEFIGSSAPRLSILSMKPFKPQETFVRWATCYLAQFGKDWLTDSSRKSFDPNAWEGRRYNFAAEVWATAALRMETDCEMKQRERVADVVGNKEQVSFLAPSQWMRFNGSPNDQIFAKKQLLEYCYRSPQGFPYNKPIIELDEGLLSTGVYKSLIKDALSELPSHLFNVVGDLQPEQLEWFAIFIWIGGWNGCGTDDGSATPSDRSPSDRSPTSATRVIPAARKSMLKPSHAPVRTLQDQLGMDEDLTLDMCTFPFARQGYGRFLWRNRSVLQVSARIDNWLALILGHQFEKLFRKNEALGMDSEPFITAHAFLENTGSSSSQSMVDSEGNVDEHERSDRIFNYHRELEKSRLRYQLARLEAPFRHLDQGITFMGCAMETLRTFLAENLELERPSRCDDDASHIPDDSWSPELPVNNVVSFNISEQLVACLKDIAGDRLDDDLFDSTVQERMLWECQNGIVKILVEKLKMMEVDWENDKGPQRFAQTMMLAILAFPALSIERTDDGVKTNEDDMLTFILSPLAPPQPFAIVIEASAKRARVHLRIKDESGREDRFRWQDWRDAFHGRLYGKAEWQRAHYMRDLHVNRTRERIEKKWKRVPVGENRDIPLWEGWQPFRARIRKFELEHSSLIIVGDEMPHFHLNNPHVSSGSLDVQSSSSENGELIARPPMTLQPQATSPGMTAYMQASTAALSDASAHVDSILRLNSSLFDQYEQKKLTEPGSDDEFSSRPILQPSPRLSPDSSGDDSAPQVRMLWNKTIEQDLIERVNEQDADAMYTLSKHLLEGHRPFRKDRGRALLLLARAITIGLDLKAVCRFVKALLATDSVSDEAIERSLAAIEKIWRDMPTRHKMVSVDGQRQRQWRNNPNGAESKRMQKLVSLHLKVVNMRRRADLMRDLADRLSLWGKSEGDHEMAVVLYESAIIADCDVWAMVGLALLFADRDLVFAKKLYYRAKNENWQGEDDGGWRSKEISDYVSELGRNGDGRAKKLCRPD